MSVIKFNSILRIYRKDRVIKIELTDLEVYNGECVPEMIMCPCILKKVET